MGLSRNQENFGAGVWFNTMVYSSLMKYLTTGYCRVFMYVGSDANYK